MTFTTMLLVVLAVWSLVMLVTFDKLTAGPRRAVLAWLATRRHHETHRDSLRGRCRCGWEVTVHGMEVRATGEPSGFLPPSVDAGVAVAQGLVAHIDTSRITDAGWVASLLGCPYCVAMWVAAPTAGTAVLWPTNRVWQAIMLALGARAVAGTLSVQLTPPDDPDIEPVT